MDFFNCRLPKAHTHRSGSKTQSSEGFAEDPIAEFQALERNVACAQRWAMEAGSLLQAFHHVLSLPTPSSPSSQAVRMEPQLSSTLREAVEVLVNAQRTMRCCWVFRWHASTQQLETGPMEFWLGEFQTACSTLEAALGPSFQAAWQSHMPHLEASEQRWPLLESSSGDLHDVMWRLEALELSHDDLLRLMDSVCRLEQRLLSGARSGRFYGEPPGVLSRFAQKALSWLGL